MSIATEPRTWLTPVELEVLLHLYHRTEPLPEDPPHQNALRYLQPIGAVNLNPVAAQYEWSITNKGEAWVRMLLNAPPPRKAWVDQKGNVMDFVEENET